MPVPSTDVVVGVGVALVEVVVVSGRRVEMEEEGTEDVVVAVVDDAAGEVVMAALVDDGFDADVDADVTTGLGMKNPWAQTRPQPSKQHLPDLTPRQSASDLQSS